MPVRARRIVVRVTEGADLKAGGTVTDVADWGLSAGEDAEGNENDELAFDEFQNYRDWQRRVGVSDRDLRERVERCRRLV